MNSPAITRLVRATEITEGAGVTVHRTIGTPALRHLDPFLMLDHFGSDDPGDYIAGFPDHPHRGFITLTYMLDGHMRHRDSMGNEGDLRTGGAQWMKAASGVIHSEMPQQTDGLMRGFQLWINLPAAEKMSDPAYQEIAPETIPMVEGDGVRVRLLAGSYGGAHGPVRDAHTDVHYLDVTLAPGARFRHEIPDGRAGFLYPFEGAVQVSGTDVPRHHLAVLAPGGVLEAAGGEGPARFLLVFGRPLGEPIVQYGPFVMTSREEVEQAMADYRAGRLVRSRAEVVQR